jgi:hypothetical protein
MRILRFFADFPDFIQDAGGWGLTSALAALVTLIISLVQPTGRYPLLVASVLLFWLGAYVAWKREHGLFRQEQSRNAKPSFKGEVEIIYVADTEPHLTVNTQAGERRIFTWRFIARLTVVNTTPAASSIRKFSMKITSEKDSYTHNLDSTPPIDPGFEIWPCDDALSPILKPSDFPPLACSQRLEQGHHQTGWIAFELKNSHLSAEQMKYDIFAIDAYGESHLMSFNNTQCKGAVYRPTGRL